METVIFDDILQDMKQQLVNDQQSLYQNLVAIITFFERIPLNVAFTSLTNLSQSFLHILPLNRNPVLKNRIEKNDFVLTLTETGRLDIFHEKIDKYQDINGNSTLGTVAVEQAYFDMIYDLWAEKERRDDFFYSLIEDTIQKWHQQGILNDKIDEAIDWIRRVETIFMYAGHKYFVSALLPNTTLVRKKVHFLRKDSIENAREDILESFCHGTLKTGQLWTG